jgi:anti-sigma28 factor (negative regulator of flagellin synthesis)
MKIDDRSNLGGVASPGAKGAGGVESGGRQDAGRAVDRTGTDRAELSGLAGKIAQATSIDASQRAEKVQRLKVEVAQGRYQPDASATSRGIVNDALLSSARTGGSQEK